jgi:hypothetical protein
VGGPEFDDGKLVFSDFLNLFIFNSKENLGGVVKALSNKGLFQSLAEPNLIATNGKEASFLAGGEYPYPVVQSGSGTNSVTITFKEFGVRLSFTPTVLGGDLVHLKVKPEVSTLDFANAVVIDGFRVPALATRRTETEVELRDGQTFAIAGLMNNTLTNTMSKIPGIGDIPILGLLFKSKAHQKQQTELVVMITPTIIRKGQMGVSESLPSLVEPYLSRPDKTYPSPDPYTGSPRYPADRPQPREGNAPVTPKSGAAQQMPAPLSPVTQPAAPIPSRPIQQPPSAARPAAPQGGTIAPPAAKTSAAPASMPAPAQASPTVKSEVMEVDRAAERAAQKAMEQERKAAEAEARQQSVAQAKAEEDRRQADRLAKERAKREAEIARKNAENAKKQADQDAKREKALTEAAARLKEAQAAYQAEVERAKGGSNEKPGSTIKQ